MLHLKSEMRHFQLPCHNDPHKFYLDKTDSIDTISETRKKEPSYGLKHCFGLYFHLCMSLIFMCY